MGSINLKKSCLLFLFFSSIYIEGRGTVFIIFYSCIKKAKREHKENKNE